LTLSRYWYRVIYVGTTEGVKMTKDEALRKLAKEALAGPLGYYERKALELAVAESEAKEAKA
jgi:hypothetical protein